MAQTIMTRYEMIVTEYDPTGYYYPKYKTRQIVITDSVEKAKQIAIDRAPNRSGRSWSYSAKVESSEDIQSGYEFFSKYMVLELIHTLC